MPGWYLSTHITHLRNITNINTLKTGYYIKFLSIFGSEQLVEQCVYIVIHPGRLAQT